MAQAAQHGPLHNLAVVSWPRQEAAKLLGMLLADYGACVVEVGATDAEVRPSYELAEQVWRRGKIMVAASLSELQGLVARAGVFLTDMGDGELEAAALDPGRLLAAQPDLVIGRISGYGVGSGRADRPWSETLVTASAGLPWQQAGQRPGPRFPAFAAGSTAAAFQMLAALMAALHDRSQTGLGQVVDSSIYDGLLSQQTLGWFWAESLPPLEQWGEVGSRRLLLAPFLAADGKYVHVHTGSRGAFTRLMKLTGLDDRVPPIATSALSEMGQPLAEEEAAVIRDELPGVFLTRPRDEWMRLLRENDIPTMPDLLPGECYDDPHVLENELTTLVELAEGGRVRAPGVVLKYSATPGMAGTVATDVAGAEEAKRTLPGVPPAAPGRAGDQAYPLAGLRVVDFGIYYAGPYASRLLGDLGADVIKVEVPEGCPSRVLRHGFVFNASNRGKRTLALDLKHPRAREVVRRLVEWADVVHHNMRPGVAESLGIGSEELRATKPSLIYCHSPAYGSAGPYRGFPGFEPLASAFVGLLMRSAGQGNPPVAAIGSMDPGNGMLGAAAILMALYHRDATGEGQQVECPQLGSALLCTPETVVLEDGAIVDPMGIDAEQWGVGWWNRLYPAGGGEWVAIDAWTGQARTRLLALAGAQEVDAAATIAAWTSAQAAEALRDRLVAAGIPCEVLGPDYEAGRFFHGADDERLGRFVAYEATAFGRARDFRSFWRFSRSPLPEERFFAHGIGADSAEILAEIGFNQAAIAAMASERTTVLGSGDA